MIATLQSNVTWSDLLFNRALPQIEKPRERNPFTAFSKAIPESFGLSFGRSAGDFCDRSCRLWGSCYATRIERIYNDLHAKLADHYWNGPEWVLDQALAHLSEKPIQWARLSVDGSLPARKDLSARQWRSFGQKLRELVLRAKALGAKWHIPVETMNKARSYRSLLKGTGVIVRRTSQSDNLSDLIQGRDHRAWVVANRIHSGGIRKDEKEANIALAHIVAEQIRGTGQTAVVCPAIAGKSKCGKCCACASPKVDVVLYPFHP